MVLSYGYDQDSNTTSLSATVNGTADFQNTYSYDKLDEMTQVVQSGQTGGNSVAYKWVTFNYEPDGQFASIDRYAGTSDSSLVVEGDYGYDGAGRLTSINYSQNSTALAGYSWTYNADNNVATFTNAQHSAENAAYGYDPAGQLTSATYANNPSANESYAFDANGNKTSGGSAVSAWQRHRRQPDFDRRHVQLFLRQQRQSHPAGFHRQRLRDRLRLRFPQPADGSDQ